MNKEYSKALNQLSFSAQAKTRMAHDLVEASKQKEGERSPSRPGSRRLLFIAATLACVVVLSVGAVGAAYATGAITNVGGAFDDLFNGPPAKTDVVNKIGKPIGASASSNGVTITADTIIGDRQNYVMVFDIQKDDGSIFDEPAPAGDGLIPLGFDGPSGVEIDGVLGASGSSYFHKSSDDRLQYVYQMSVNSASNNIINHTARVHLHDLYVYDKGNSKLVAQGDWNMKFTVNYEDTSLDLPAGEQFNLNDMNATLNSVLLSPIALTLNYTVNAPFVINDQKSGKMSEENQTLSDSFLGQHATLTMKDGSSIQVSNKGGGQTEQKDNTTICKTSILFDHFVDLDAVASVSIGGVVIPVVN